MTADAEFQVTEFTRSIRAACSNEPHVAMAKNPHLHIDGAFYELKKMAARVSGKVAFAAGVNQRDLERLCALVDVERLAFKGLRAIDITPLQQMRRLTELQIFWAPKLETVAPLAGLNLRLLVLKDLKRLHDLSPISKMRTLEVLEFSGGMWSVGLATSLAPLAQLPHLLELHLANLKVAAGGLRPLSGCKSLNALCVSNQFETADYAYLAAKLPGTKCEHFAPYVPISSAIVGRDVMVTGRRKPLLDSKKDAARLQKYSDRFQQMVDEFRRGSE